ncbi:MAG TPA: hypothetical protein VF074_20505 [Pyrinomonadaceae bacterium]
MQTKNQNTGESSDLWAANRWFTIAIIVYVLVEAVCIAVLMYLWLSNQLS